MLYATVWTWGDICVAWDGVSRVYDVWVMSTRHGCQAIASRQVCMTRRDYRHVQRALGEVEWRRWVVKSCAGGLREVIGRWRYMWRGANTGIRQERFWASWCDDEAMWALGRWFVTCLKCSFAYLLRRDMLTAVAQGRLEGQKAEVSRWSIWAYVAKYKAILSRNRLLGHA